MPDYKKLYHQLFNDITDIIEKLPDSQFAAIERLKKAQIDAEERYLDMCEEEYPNGEDSEDNCEED